MDRDTLISKLISMPQGSKVYTSNYDGCLECNPEGFPTYHEVYRVEFKECGDYPNDERDVIIIT